MVFCEKEASLRLLVAMVRLLLLEPRIFLMERLKSNYVGPQNWIRLWVSPATVARSESEIDERHEVTAF